MTTTNTVITNEIQLDPIDKTKTAWGSTLGAEYYFVLANGTAAAEDFDAADLSADVKGLMATHGRGISVSMGAGDDSVIGSAFGDTITGGDGVNLIDGGANDGSPPWGGRAYDVLNVFAASQAAADALDVTELGAASTGADKLAYDKGYRIKVTNGSETDYLKGIEQVNVFLASDRSYVKTVGLAVNVNEIGTSQDAAKFMHLAWAQGSGFNDSFSVADVSAPTRALMDQHGRGLWVDLGAGDDTVTGSAYGDDITAGSGTNHVDGGANGGSPPWGGNAQDVLRVVVNSQAAADAVQVTQLTSGMSGADAQAVIDGYTHKVVAGGETDYIKGIERVSVQINTGGSWGFGRDIALAVTAHEANLADANIASYYHLAWVNGTDGTDTIDAGATGLLSASLKSAMATYGRGIWIDGGAGDDIITGSGYADNFRNGAGSAHIDGGANVGGQDVFEISVASTAEMSAVQVTASDDPGYKWMVTYGSGSQKDYLKNVEAITVNVAGTSTGKWIPLAVSVQEIAASGEPAKSMHFAWVQGTGQDDSFDAASGLSAPVKALMDQHGRGIYVDTGAGNDSVVGSGYGDDISVGSGTNYVDGGANAGSPPWGGKAQDVLRVTVASQAAADAVQVTQLAAGMGGTDAEAFTKGYTHKVVAGAETDYIKGIERVSVQVETGNGGSSFGRDIPLAVVVQEANLADATGTNYGHLAWVNGTAGADTIDAGGSSLLSPELKAAMDARGRGIWIDGGAGNDTITGSAYADNFRNGAGNAHIDGGANTGGMDVFEVAVANAAEMSAVQVTASDDPAYTWMVTYGVGTQKDYLKNVEAIAVNVTGGGAGKWIPLALSVQEIGATGDLARSMHYAWAQGTSQNDNFNAGTDLSAATRTLMGQHGRGIYVDTGAGDDTIVGSGYGDNIRAGSGTNYVDGGANAGTQPGGAKAQDVLQVNVASQAAADAVQVTQLAAGMTGTDEQAFAAGYTHKVVAGSETDYIKGIERVSVQIDTGNGGSTFGRDIPLVVSATEANLADPNIANYYHLAWVNGTAGADTIDAGGDTPLLSAALKAAQAAQGRGVWIDGGAGDDIVTGSAYADNIRNGAGNAKIDGGANAGPNGQAGKDTFEISVASSDEMNAVKVSASDDPAYTWMVTYGAGTQKDYLKNIEGISVFVTGSGAGKWIPLALGVQEIAAGENLDNSMHYAWVQGTGAGENFNAATDISAATRALMTQHGRGVYVDMGAGNDTVTTTAYGDNIVSGSGTNYIDAGANLGAQPGGAKARDVLDVFVADQAAANAVSVTALTAAMSGADGSAFAAGYRYKVANGAVSTDYVTGVEQVNVHIWNDKDGDGQRDYAGAGDLANEVSFVRGIALDAQANTAPTFAGAPAGVVVQEAGADFGTMGSTVLASGKIFALAYLRDVDASDARLVLSRSNADGSIDTSFGNGSGKVTLPGVYAGGTTPVEVAGGKVLVAHSTSSSGDFKLTRVNADGSLDTSFGTGGAAVVSFGPALDQPRKVLVDAAGKIVVVGTTNNGANIDMAVTRLNADGSLDTSFNGTGKLTLALSSANDAANAAAIQSNGKIVLAGSTQGAVNADFAVVRLNTDGSLDTSFGTGGKVVLAAGAGADSATSVQILADGKILLGGNSRSGAGASTDQDPALMRLNADGSIDTSFGSGGTVHTHVTGNNDFLNAFQVQADGKIVTLGTANNSPSSLGGEFLISRYNADGALDTSFGVGGMARVQVRGIGEQALSLALVGGKIMVFGNTINDNDYNVSNVIFRLNGDGSVDTGFGAAPVSSVGGTVRGDAVHAVALDINAAVYDAELAAIGSYGGASVTLVRHGGASADDVFAGVGEVSFANGKLSVGTTAIGTVAQDGGTLTLTFLGNASQGLVNRALHGIGYTNVGSAADSVTIDWRFSDNDGGQGSASALTALASSTVQIGLTNREVMVSSSDPTSSTQYQPLSSIQFMADVGGTGRADSFDSASAFSGAVKALMAQYGRGARFDMGPGNDNVTGTAYTDEFTMGSGVNRVDGGANGGSSPYGLALRDQLKVYAPTDALAAAVSVTALGAGASGDDAAAFAAGYAVKVVNGAEVDYLKNVETVTIYKWNDANGNGMRDGNEISWAREIALAMRVDEVRVSATDPTRDSGGNLLSDQMHFAWVSARFGDTSFNAGTDISAPTRALMALHGRGVYVDTGAGNDTVTGSDWGDNFRLGSGVNRLDGGANLGTAPRSTGPASDTLDVYVASAAASEALQAVALTGAMSGADLDAYNAGYKYKIDAGAEVDYIRNIETVNVWKWADNGNGVTDPGEVTYARQIQFAMYVNELKVSATDATRDSNGNLLADQMNFAWVNGAFGDDSFNAAADISAPTLALMAQYGRGVYADTGAGNDTVTGSDWGDSFTLGTGVNRVDGGANLGTLPGSTAKASDVLNLYVASAAAGKALQPVVLTGDMSGADLDAFKAGYKFKLDAGAEVDYIRNVESVNVWQRADGGTGEVTFVRQIALAVQVQEIEVSATDPTTDRSGNPLSQYDTLAWVTGTAGADTVTSAVVSAATQGYMTQAERGISFDLRGGGDTVSGSDFGDRFITGAGINFVDGGANRGSQPGRAGADVLDIFVASQALLDAVSVTTLTGTLSGRDAEAQAAGYQFKIVAGQETDYVKNLEQWTVSIWEDKNGDGQRGYSNDPVTNEVTGRVDHPLDVTLVGVPTP